MLFARHFLIGALFTSPHCLQGSGSLRNKVIFAGSCWFCCSSSIIRFSCHVADDGSSLWRPELRWAITATPPALTATGDKQTQAAPCSRWLQCHPAATSRVGMETPRDNLLGLPCSDLPSKAKSSLATQS